MKKRTLTIKIDDCKFCPSFKGEGSAFVFAKCTHIHRPMIRNPRFIVNRDYGYTNILEFDSDWKGEELPIPSWCPQIKGNEKFAGKWIDPPKPKNTKEDI